MILQLLRLCLRNADVQNTVLKLCLHIGFGNSITDIEAKLDAMSVGGLLGLWFQSLFVGLTMKALSICIMLVVYCLLYTSDAADEL